MTPSNRSYCHDEWREHIFNNKLQDHGENSIVSCAKKSEKWAQIQIFFKHKETYNIILFKYIYHLMEKIVNYWLTYLEKESSHKTMST